jgi:hypothetical protein
MLICTIFSNDLKQGAILPLLFNFALEHAIRKGRWVGGGILEKLESNGTHQLLVYADDTTLLGENINAIKKNKNSFRVTRRLVRK